MKSITFQWRDFGENVDDWNKEFPRKNLPLFNGNGFGIYLQSPPSSASYYFVSSTPFISGVVTVSKGMHYSQGVEEVFYIDFLNAEGEKHHSPSLRIERTNNFLTPVPIICGLSPDQIRRSLLMVEAYLNNRLNT